MSGFSCCRGPATPGSTTAGCEEKLTEIDERERQELASLRRVEYRGFTELLEFTDAEATHNGECALVVADNASPQKETPPPKEAPPPLLSPYSKAAAAQAEYEASLRMPRRLTTRLGDVGCRFVEKWLGLPAGGGALGDNGEKYVDEKAWERQLLDNMPEMLRAAAGVIERLDSNLDKERRIGKEVYDKWEQAATERNRATQELERLKRHPGADNPSAIHWEDRYYEESIRNTRLQAQVEILQETIREHLPVPDLVQWKCNSCSKWVDDSRGSQGWQGRGSS